MTSKLKWFVVSKRLVATIVYIVRRILARQRVKRTLVVVRRANRFLKRRLHMRKDAWDILVSTHRETACRKCVHRKARSRRFCKSHSCEYADRRKL